MYKMFMSAESYDFVRRAISCLALEVRHIDQPGGFWVCYGSFVLNKQTTDSDIDLLYIHNQAMPVRRIQSSFESHQVTIYLISRNDLMNDGELKMFGGYFSGKLLNPFVVFQESECDKGFLMDVASKYIAPFTGSISQQQKRKTLTQFNITADSVLARLHICPWYNSYFLRYYISSDFLSLWSHMEKIIYSAFIESGVVIFNEGNLEYKSVLTPDELHAETLKVSARFWSLGCHLHNSRFDFSDYYIQKSEQFIDNNNLSNKYLEMLAFLKSEKGGGNHGTQ